MKLKYFTDSEFSRCVPPCKMTDCNGIALELLDQLRDKCGFPLILNSAFRSVDYEKLKGRSGYSSHTKGIAFDIRCFDSVRRAEIVKNAFSVGFTRIGIATGFVHVDCDCNKINPCIWLYG